MRALEISGVYLHEPRIHRDDRGEFLEWFRAGDLAEVAGHGFGLAQANLSTSRRGSLRGLHFADVPPGQAKYVTCVRGAVLDVVVDIRVGSATFGQWEAVRLDDETRCGVYISEGLGHAFMALTDGAVFAYMCSEPYTPAREHTVNPLDPDLAIEWPADITPLLSDRDAAAPSLKEALETGLLPAYDACLAYQEKLRRR